MFKVKKYTNIEINNGERNVSFKKVTMQKLGKGPVAQHH